MQIYRKLPVEIEAIIFEYNKNGLIEMSNFLGSNLGKISKDRHMDAKAEAVILTLEDGKNGQVKHIASEGDYIIKGISGKFYPCKPDIFNKTYEEVLCK